MFLEIEIGCGKGKFLVGRAAANPAVRFRGIEKAGKWMRRGAKRGEKKGLSNLEFIRGDVWEILEQGIARESVDIFHIYFPDPWPKRRHHKRRLIQPEFLEILYLRLKKGGLVEIATDDTDYYRHISDAVREVPWEWRQIRESFNRRLFDPEFKTDYELKYSKEGRPIYYLELQK